MAGGGFRISVPDVFVCTGLQRKVINFNGMPNKMAEEERKKVLPRWLENASKP